MIMKKNTKSFSNRIGRQRIHVGRRRSLRQKLASLLSAVIVFVTVYAMILPAITLEHTVADVEPGIDLSEGTDQVPLREDPVNGVLTDDGSVQKVLDCHVLIHTHTEDCWKTVNDEKILICGKSAM